MKEGEVLAIVSDQGPSVLRRGQQLLVVARLFPLEIMCCDRDVASPTRKDRNLESKIMVGVQSGHEGYAALAAIRASIRGRYRR